MSRRNLIRKYSLFSDVDTTTDPISTYTDVSGVDFVTYEINIDTTVLAEIFVEFCNDEIITDQSVFKALDFQSPLELNGSTDTYGLVHISNNGFKYFRLYVLNNGGTGNVSASITGTGRGA